MIPEKEEAKDDLLEFAKEKGADPELVQKIMDRAVAEAEKKFTARTERRNAPRLAGAQRRFARAGAIGGLFSVPGR